MEATQVWERFTHTGALLEGHFILSSGLHSTRYLQCALALRQPSDAGAFGAALAQQWRGTKLDAVVAPALGGLIIGYEVARVLALPFFWTERDNGQMALRRGFTVQPGARLLVVEDVITTGVSTRETIAALQAGGAQVVGAASIIDRSGGRAEVGVPRVALATLDVPSFAADACELCAQGVPAIKPGSRSVSK